MKCPVCNADLPSTAKFCGGCGTTLTAAPPPAPPATPSYEQSYPVTNAAPGYGAGGYGGGRYGGGANQAGKQTKRFLGSDRRRRRRLASVSGRQRAGEGWGWLLLAAA